MELALADGFSIQNVLNDGNSSPLASPVLIESHGLKGHTSLPLATARK